MSLYFFFFKLNRSHFQKHFFFVSNWQVDRAKAQIKINVLLKIHHVLLKHKLREFYSLKIRVGIFLMHLNLSFRPKKVIFFHDTALLRFYCYALCRLLINLLELNSRNHYHVCKWFTRGSVITIYRRWITELRGNMKMFSNRIWCIVRQNSRGVWMLFCALQYQHQTNSHILQEKPSAADACGRITKPRCIHFISSLQMFRSINTNFTIWNKLNPTSGSRNPSLTHPSELAGIHLCLLNTSLLF